MERESFEDQEVAALLNKFFVPVKVDREERPDIDAVYMRVCQAMTGSGGWPTTVFLAPDQTPFFAGTYFPKYTRYSLMGLLELLQIIAEKWKEDRQMLLQAGKETLQILEKEPKPLSGEPGRRLFARAKAMFSRSFDPRWGGFGGAPKFPSAHNLLFLLRYSVWFEDQSALNMVEKTLEQMYRGGLFDHVGGGFSRYSTDEKWLVPHFEKMLYDNALLVMAYLEAYQLTGRALFAEVARRTLSYIRREMTHPEGGFYSAQDADSEGVEGKYYLFSPGEIRSLLGEADGQAFCRYFDLSEWGNFEGKSIPNLIAHKDVDLPDDKIRGMAETVYRYRLNRTKLHKDDKILTAWNALMAAAFLKAYTVLREPAYLETAAAALDFARRNLAEGEDGLRVRWREGEASGTGFLDDYAFTVHACLTLYDATLDEAHLEEAARYGRRMVRDFADGKNGGFYLYAGTGEQLITRPKEIYDGAMPSGNSMAGYVLVRLSQLTGDPFWQEAARRQISFMTGYLESYPISSGFALVAGMCAFFPPTEFTCVTQSQEDLTAFLQTLSAYFLPNSAAAVKRPGKAGLVPFARVCEPVDGQTTYYFCENNACHPPVTDLEALRQLLSQARFVEKQPVFQP